MKIAVLTSLGLGLSALFSFSPSVSAAKTQRKEVRAMSSSELDAYFSALWSYKTSGRKDSRGYFETYDSLVAHHAIAATNVTGDKAHQYAGFIVWHAVFVKELEQALQSIDPTVAVPYWDWTIDAKLADPRTSDVFTDAYFGSSSPSLSDNYNVVDGPLLGWEVSTSPSSYGFTSYNKKTGYMRNANNYNPSPYLTRYVGGGKAGTLPTSTQYNSCVSSTSYSNFANCVWGTVGSMSGQSVVHGTVHGWVGGMFTSTSGSAMGDMMDPITSPNDPLFFSHHGNLDRMYWEYRAKTGDALATESDPCGGFYGKEVTTPQPEGHDLNDVLSPSFFAFRSLEEIDTLGPLTIAEACYFLQTDNYDVEYV